MANGIGDEEIHLSHTEPDEKSMGHENTFEKDVIDPNRINGMLLFLCEKVSRRLRQSGYNGRTITLKIKYSDRKLITRARTICKPTDCDVIIYNNAKYLLEKNRFCEKPIRLIGVSVSKLEKGESDIQPDLLGNPNDRNKKIDSVLDVIRDRYGDHTVSRAGTRLGQHFFNL